MDTSKIAADQLRTAMSAERNDLHEEAGQHALVSIAASLRQLVELQILQNHYLAGLAHPPVMMAPIPVELVADGGCCRQEANDADDLLEAGFGLICNADNSISSGGRLKAEWKASARRFNDRYIAMMSHRYGTGAVSWAADLDERSAD